MLCLHRAQRAAKQNYVGVPKQRESGPNRWKAIPSTSQPRNYIFNDNFYRNKTPRSTKLCWGPRRFKIKSLGRLKLLVSRTAETTSTTSKSKSLIVSNWKLRLRRSTWKKKIRWTTLFKEWSPRTEKWPVFRTWRCSKLKLTWSCPRMRREPSLGVKKKWKPSKTRWFASMPSSNSNAWTRFKRLRMQLRKLAIKYSEDSRLRRWLDVQRKNFKRTFATSLISKRVSLRLVPVRKLN